MAEIYFSKSFVVTVKRNLIVVYASHFVWAHSPLCVAEAISLDQNSAKAY